MLKASARSSSSYNIGYLIQSLINNNIILSGGGHSMAAGFTMKKTNLKLLDNFIQNDYLKKNSNLVNLNQYDFNLSPSAIKIKLIHHINKLKPFGNYNSLPIFLINNLKVIKHSIINNKHLSVVLKPVSGGSSIKGICFNCLNTNIGHYLLSYKKKINIIAQIKENIWNNKKTIQLNIKDLIL